MNRTKDKPRPINQEEAKLIIKQLVNDHPVDLNYRCFTRYATTLGRLWITVGNLDVAASIFIEIVNQATELDKSMEWINSELGFELVATQQKDRRREMIQQRLKEGNGSDAALDLYNERLARFSGYGPNSPICT
ncbi:hypothetical protein [Larkinella sp. C7]|uniref:hypothetical protein n=1 Tax=Larkinella sp. C7 TaxID=2576607 RepID=UPI001111606B|nr:hypothetical protein [Larkinella sp. C7]